MERQATGAGLLNVKDFGNGVGAGNDDTAAFAAARAEQVALRGGVIYAPKGTYLIRSLIEDGPIPLVMVGDGEWTVLQTTAAATVALTLADSVNLDGDTYLSGFRLKGTSANLGGIKFGSATRFVAFAKLNRVRVDGFTGAGAYGVSLDSVQELRLQDCMIRDNYNNVERPDHGFCTSAVFDGGFIGRASNRGAELRGTISDLTFRNKCVLEWNGKEAIHQSGRSAIVTLDDVYVEANLRMSGEAQIAVLGAAGRPSRLLLINSHFHVPDRANPAGAQLKLDHCDAYVENNDGLESGRGIVTTSNTDAHFRNNRWSGSAANWAVIYRALLGNITADDTDPNGKRFFYGARYMDSGRFTSFPSTRSQAGFNLPHGTAPESPVNGDMWTTAAGLFVRINGRTIGPLS